MKDKRIYKNGNWGGEFPKPDVPADDAWNQMHSMLIENNLTNVKKKDKRRLIIIWFLLFAILIGSVGSYVLLNNKTQITSSTANTITDKNNIVVNKRNNLNGDTNKYNNSLIKTDSINEKPVIIIAKHSTISVSQNNRHANKDYIDLKQQGDHLNEESSVVNDQHQQQKNNSEHNEANILNTIIDTTAEDDKQTTKDTLANNIDTSNSKRKTKSATPKSSKLHFGLEWNGIFSLANNKNYFDNYSGGKQYYMWLLPSAWAKINISKKQGIILSFNPYLQQFAGSKTVHKEVPWIASVEPDIVTSIVKTRGINIGLNYSYQLTKRLNLQAGGNYTFIQNALFNEQSVEESSGNVLSERIYGARKKDDAFKFIKPSYLSWNAGVEYNFKKISIGANINQSLRNLSADSNYSVKPLNGNIYIKLHLK